MSKIVDMTGEKFGHLKVIEMTDTGEAKGRKYWKCRCDCGTIIEVRGDNLRRGISTQCSYCAGQGGRSREIIQRVCSNER